MDKVKVAKSVEELVNSMIRAEGETELQKEIKDQLKEKEGIPPARSARWAKLKYLKDYKPEKYLEEVEKAKEDAIIIEELF